MSILTEAEKIIYGDREKTYGSPDKNLALIASYWSSHLSTPINVNDVCIMMTLLKLARLKNSPTHKDSMQDGCGYLALMERVQEYRSTREFGPLTKQTIEEMKSPDAYKHTPQYFEDTERNK